MDDAARNLVLLGRVVGAHGVRGWVNVSSDTEPAEGILDYSPWWIGREGSWRRMRPLEGRCGPRGVTARLDGCESRDDALALAGSDVAVERDRLPALAPDDYYWTDLVGLEVRTRGGEVLGRVGRLMETGANDVLVVEGERERLIPFLVDQVVVEIDLAQRRILVDWDPEF